MNKLKVNVVYDNFSEFEKIATPTLNSLNFTMRNHTMLALPLFLSYNKTYYRLQDNNLTAFRILGYCVMCNHYDVYVAYYVQTPNHKPFWRTDFIIEQSVILENKEDMFDYMKGATFLNINGCKKWCRIHDLMLNNEHIFYDNIYRNLTYTWIWDKNTKRPKRISSQLQYLVFTPNSINIGVNLNYNIHCGDKHYPSAEDCIKEKLNGFTISDFEDEPFEMNIAVLPQTPKIHVLKFIEDEIC